MSSHTERSLVADGLSQPKAEAIAFESDPFALCYRRPSAFWQKVGARTRLARGNRQAELVVGRRGVRRCDI